MSEKSKKEELIFTKEDNEIMLEAIDKAAKKLWQMPKGKLEKTFFSVWVEAIHKLLLRRECPCQKGISSQCFLALKPKEQKKALKGHPLLDFGVFLEVLNLGEQLLLRDIIEANKNRNIN